ncbi:hypothetical protein VTK73DRAFT_1960 [Phialemonium thermophilum]|uniref:HECT-type E3 ubiquitin transferase n=1 Tax=Phialemonium thermophilum TaxID=223376 RepID=A0ABR3X6P4_9PEZI
MSTEDLPALGDKLSPKATLPTAVSSPTEIQKGGMDSSLDDSALDQDLNGQQRQQQSQHQQQPSRTLGGGPSRSNDPRRNSTARVRTSSGPKPKRKSSIDPFLQDGVSDDPLPALLRSPRHAPQNEKQPPVLKASAANGSVSRPISQLTTAGYFDAVSLEKMPPSKPAEPKSAVGVVQTDGSTTDERASPRSFETGIRIVSDGSSSDRSSQGADVELGTDVDWQPPQALSRLDADIVDFICDVLQDTNGCEKHGLEPPAVRRLHTTGTSHNRILRRRKSQKRQRGAPGLDAEWRLFIEQSIFYVLSDARLAVRSFMRDGSLYDSQSLWYCMLRMTRVRPSLVFHSLWMAAASLFAPPKSVQSLRSPTARLFPKLERSLSNAEAGCLLSICLHALVAAAPLVSDQQQLLDMSRIRSHGLSLAGSGAIARQPASLCLQYDEAFSNELALRLARRLFAAITARRSYDELTDLNSPDGRGQEPDVLAPLFSQLDFLNMDAVYVLNFSVSDRALHETRVPTLLLDWARAVMLHDWEGHPEVPGDGPFGGALTLMEAMYKNRHALLLGDAQFRCEYFAERLDTVEMPVSWLSQTSSKQKVHLLDYPFIFNPSTLVSYFRAINFSRMSRAFEESSSLQSRMSAIMLPGSLLTNTHHKNILQDMLSTASSKYLILDIDREHVLKNALDQLWRREERELLRPLKVHLGEEGGEEGFDSGGVQQEFFRLAIAEALNPDYGAFTVDERTRMAWFLPGSLEPDWKFELIGLLVSLAVYNGLTLPVTFPKALYRKLLGEPVTDLHHIEDGWPELASGLTSLLEWDEKDGLVEDVFARTYEFSVSVFGVHVSREMKPPTSDESWPRFPAPTWQGSRTPDAGNPGDPPLVTRENRDAYVSDYIRYLTDVSVRPQYEAFARGFRSCLHPKSLTLLNSNLLQSLVEGVQQIDIGELRRHARYVGWDASHRTVRDFWSIVKRYDDAMKRKLLEFVTASDRVPVSGMKNLQFVLQRNGIEEDENGHLPTAYTCYGTLLLPEYRDKEVLRERLAMALENAQGFGFA